MYSQIKCQDQLVTSPLHKAIPNGYSLPINGIFFFEGEHFVKNIKSFYKPEYYQ